MQLQRVQKYLAAIGHLCTCDEQRIDRALDDVLMQPKILTAALRLRDFFIWCMLRHVPILKKEVRRLFGGADALCTDHDSGLG